MCGPILSFHPEFTIFSPIWYTLNVEITFGKIQLHVTSSNWNGYSFPLGESLDPLKGEDKSYNGFNLS
jgi:hypothetical protein